jgi:hypothetical protein
MLVRVITLTKNNAFDTLIKVVWVSDKWIHEFVSQTTWISFETQIWVMTHRLKHPALDDGSVQNE